MFTTLYTLIVRDQCIPTICSHIVTFIMGGEYLYLKEGFDHNEYLAWEKRHTTIKYDNDYPF